LVVWRKKFEILSLICKLFNLQIIIWFEIIMTRKVNFDKENYSSKSDVDFLIFKNNINDSCTGPRIGKL
jgi:hypothetical protein